MAAVVVAVSAAPAMSQEPDASQARIRTVVDAAIQPLMAKNAIAGMAVGIVARGKSYVFAYGVASTATAKPVTRDTLFELGSVSKTLTATLASCAQLEGHLSLSDRTDKYLPSLRGSSFGAVSLLELGRTRPAGCPCRCPRACTRTTI